MAKLNTVQVTLPQHFRLDGVLYYPGAQAIPRAVAKEHGLLKFSDEDQEPETDLPDDLPGRAALAGAGYTEAKVQQASDDDLLGVDGIGETTAQKVRAYYSDEDQEADEEQTADDTEDSGDEQEE